MSRSTCQTCADLLQRLSLASERLFLISSRLTCETLELQDGPEQPLPEHLALQAWALRAECELIRTVLQDHRAQRHSDALAIAG